MLFSIFILISLSFTLLFLFIIYRAAVLLKREIGVWAVIILILGILPKSSNSLENSKTEWTYNSDKVFVKGTKTSKTINVEDNFFSTVELLVSSGLDSASKKYIPLEARVLNQGLSVKGSKFITNDIILRPTGSPKMFKYEIYGMRKWEFFVILKYNESKVFTGFINIK